MQLRFSLHDRRLLLAARFALLVALPFLLGLYVLPHTQSMDGRLLSPPDAQQNSTDVLSYSFASAGDSMLLEQSVGSVFPLSNYLDFPPLVSHDRLQLCFRDNGSSIDLPNGTRIIPDMSWEVHVNNDPPLLLNASSQACSDITNRGQIYYAWTAKINTEIDRQSLNGSITFNPETLTYPRLEMNYGLLQGIVMIPVFYLLVWYPAIGIWKKLREGMLSQ